MCDFIYVSDLVCGYLCVLDCLLGCDESFVCNLGIGYGVFVLEVLKVVVEVVGWLVFYFVYVCWVGDLVEFYVNIGYVCYMLGFKIFWFFIKGIVIDVWNYYCMNV